jgi:uncharacterized protein (DUF1501 family)
MTTNTLGSGHGHGTGPTTDHDECGCSEGRRLQVSRRGLFAAFGGTALLTATLGEAQLAFSAEAATQPNVLLTVVLAGGMDGLSLVVPLGDPDYARNRPDIQVPAAKAHKVDSRFGLHPALAPLFPLWTSGKFAAVHAVGQESPTRSHFEAMDEMDRAAPNSSIRTGWLNRTLGMMTDTGALEAVSFGQSSIPGLLRGDHPSLAAWNLDSVQLPVDLNATPLSLWTKAIGQLHSGARPEVTRPMAGALEAIDLITKKVPAAGTGMGDYPNNGYGQGLKDVARLIKADVGLRVATVTLGDWDHHVGLGTPDGGRFLDNAAILANGLAAFAADLGSAFDRVTTLTLSEFGRRVQQNGNGGVDHGHGNVVLALGGGLNGGKVFGKWPGLAVADLDLGLDLKATTDYRSILAEVLTKRMGISSAKTVFPGFTPVSVGLVK